MKHAKRTASGNLSTPKNVRSSDVRRTVPFTNYSQARTKNGGTMKSANKQKDSVKVAKSRTSSAGTANGITSGKQRLTRDAIASMLLCGFAGIGTD